MESTVWYNGQKDRKKVFELYGHTTDPEENKNIANETSSKSVVASLSKPINERMAHDLKTRKRAGHKSVSL